jgi:hypothetical protein
MPYLYSWEEKKYRGAIQGRKQLENKDYTLMNPTATLNDINQGCNLNVHNSTLFRYISEKI